MIAYLEGKVIEKDPTFVIMDVKGVGYIAKISLHTYGAIKDKETIRLQTHLHIREDAHILYGFVDKSEKNNFLDLISINGVGGNTALMILSTLSPLELQEAIANEQAHVIQKVKGVGTKTAQRIVLELKDKMEKMGWETKSKENVKTDNHIRSEALAALTVLGIPRSQAQKNIDATLKQYGADISLEDLIKQALRKA